MSRLAFTAGRSTSLRNRAMLATSFKRKFERFDLDCHLQTEILGIFAQ